MKDYIQQLIGALIKYTKSLRDVRVLGLQVFIAIAILVTWNSIGVIQSNYELQQDLSRLEQENLVKELENETLQLRNLYYETDQYLELAARKQFSKGAAGETLILVADDVAREYSSEPLDLESNTVSAPEKPSYQKNFEAWMEFFFRREKSL